MNRRTAAAIALAACALATGGTATAAPAFGSLGGGPVGSSVTGPTGPIVVPGVGQLRVQASVDLGAVQASSMVFDLDVPDTVTVDPTATVTVGGRTLQVPVTRGPSLATVEVAGPIPSRTPVTVTLTVRGMAADMPVTGMVSAFYPTADGSTMIAFPIDGGTGTVVR